MHFLPVQLSLPDLSQRSGVSLSDSLHQLHTPAFLSHSFRKETSRNANTRYCPKHFLLTQKLFPALYSYQSSISIQLSECCSKASRHNMQFPYNPCLYYTVTPATHPRSQRPVLPSESGLPNHTSIFRSLSLRLWGMIRQHINRLYMRPFFWKPISTLRCHKLYRYKFHSLLCSMCDLKIPSHFSGNIHVLQGGFFPPTHSFRHPMSRLQNTIFH